MWKALLDLKENGESDLHPRTGQSLVDRGFAKRVGESRYRITPKGKAYGTDARVRMPRKRR
jgi:hypothetical protein